MDDSLNLSSVTGVYSKYSGKYVETKNQDSSGFDNGALDFDSYLQLLVAQMSNQDFNDPMSDADLLNQMAQYSMLQGIQDMTQQSAISYGASLVGKAVTVSDGRYYHTGLVDSINISNGEVTFIIDGQSFKTSEITDVVNMDAYNAVKELVGKTVKLKGSGENANTAVVTAVVFVNGQGHAAIGDKTYPISQLEVVEAKDSENKTDDEAESTEGAEGDAGGSDIVEGDENSGDATGVDISNENNTDDPNAEYALENGQVSESAAASYAASADALTDLLMRELDKADEVKALNAAAEQYSDNFDLGEIMKTAYVQVPEFAASAMADTNDLVLSAVDGVTAYANGDSTVSGIGNVSISDYNSSTGTGTLVDDSYTEIITDDTSRVTTTSYTSSTSQYTASGKLKGVTAAKGIAQGDGVPHRISVEKYPEEAALADELGTRMYDISQIHNHEVTSRILTGPVISRTASGKGVTEIGYSGMGQLGEVVTFEDGTQRVEILLKSGKSSWLYTSGNYTLDQICTTTGLPGSLSNMTGAEKAIRHYSQANETQLRNSGYPV